MSVASTAPAHAANEVAPELMYQGRLMNAAGTAPILDTSVDIRLGIYDPSGNCLLYEQTHTGIDLSLTDGFFSLPLGSAVGSGLRTGSDPALAMSAIFANAGSAIRAASSSNCAPGYTPSARDGRKIRVTVTAASLGGAVTLSPDDTIGSVPQALVAETLQGIPASGFIQPNTTSGHNLSQSTLDTLTNGSDGSTLHHHDSKYVQLGSASVQALGSGGMYTSGNIGVGMSVSPTATQLEVRPGSASTAGIVVKGASGQTANLFEIKDNSGTSLFKIDASGNVVLGVATPATSSAAASKGYVDGHLGGLNLDLTGLADGQVLKWDLATSKWIPGGASGGSVSSIVSGTGLSGGTITSSGTLSVDVGTTANKIVQLDGSAKLPAVDGTQLTGLLKLAGGTMSGAIDMGSSKITSLATPTTSTDAANKSYVDSAISSSGGSFLPLAGGTMTGRILGLSTPTTSTEAASKGYVDGNLGGSTLDLSGLADNQSLKWDNSTSKWVPYTPSTSSGTVSSIVSGTGLSGGTITSSGTLSVDVGTTANKIVQLDGSAKLPAVDGTQLTGLLKLAGGTMSGAIDMGSSKITSLATPTTNTDATNKSYVDGNLGGKVLDLSGLADGQVLKWDNTSTKWVPASSSAGSVTSIVASTGLSGGTITSSGTLSVDVGTTANKIVQLDGSAKLPAVDGTQLTGLLKLAGGTMSGAIDMGSSKITSLAVPTASTDAANKSYVDGNFAGNAINFSSLSNGQSIQWDSATSKWVNYTPSTSSGTVSSIVSGTGLSGGTITSSGTLSVDVGTTANKIVQLDGSAKLPAVDGTQLTGLLKLAGGTMSGAIDMGSSKITSLATPTTNTDATNKSYVDGNLGGSTLDLSGLADNQSLKWDNSTSKWVPYTPSTSSGTVSSIVSGTGLSGGTITSSGTLSVDVGTTANKIVQLDGSAKLPAVDGSQLTNLSAASLSSMTASRAIVTDASGKLSASTVTASEMGFLSGVTSAIQTQLDALLKLAGGTMSGTIDMNSNKILRLATPTTSTDAANKSYVDSAISSSGGSFLPLAGGTMTGDADFGAHKIVGLATPTTSSGAATKGYVDGNLGGSTLDLSGLANNQSLKWDNSTSKWVPYTPSTSSGTVSSIVASTGLSGGTITSSGTLSVDVGTTANKIVQLDGSAKLPAVDGTQLTGLLKLAGGTMSGAIDMGSSKITSLAAPTASTDAANKSYVDSNFAGNAINFSSLSDGQSIKWDAATSKWVNYSTSASSGTVTSIVAGTGLTAGTITSSGTLSVDVGTTANKIVQLNSSGKLPAVDGSLLTGIVASDSTKLPLAGGTMTGQLKAMAGTSGTLGITFATNCTTCGLYSSASTMMTLRASPTTSSIDFEAGGAFGMKLDQAQRLLVGFDSSNTGVPANNNSNFEVKSDGGVTFLSNGRRLGGSYTIGGVGQNMYAFMGLREQTEDDENNAYYYAKAFQAGFGAMEQGGNQGVSPIVWMKDGVGSWYGGGQTAFMVMSKKDGAGNNMQNAKTLMTVFDTGRVGIGLGSAHPTVMLHVKDTTAGATVANFQSGTGTCSITPNTGMSCSSDARLKTDIVPIENPVETLLALNGVKFRWKDQAATDTKRSVGLIAQDVERVVPELVSHDERGFMQVNYANLVAVVIEAFKDLYAKTVGHGREIASIQAEVQNLKLENRKLKEMLQQERAEAARRQSAIEERLNRLEAR